LVGFSKLIEHERKHLTLEIYALTDRKTYGVWRGLWSYEEFENTKGVIRIRKSKNNRQHNGKKKKDKRTNNDLQNIHIKLKIE